MTNLPYLTTPPDLVARSDRFAVFTHRRIVFQCPPGRWLDVYRLLVIMGLMIWAPFIVRGEEGPGRPYLLFAVLFTIGSVILTLLLKRWRARLRSEFRKEVLRLGADVDWGGCPEDDPGEYPDQLFVTRFDLERGSYRLFGPVDSQADPEKVTEPLLEQGAKRSITLHESWGHALPWSDLYEHEPPDLVRLELRIGDPPVLDLEKEFCLLSCYVDDPDADEMKERFSHLMSEV